jgi:translocator protein
MLPVQRARKVASLVGLIGLCFGAGHIAHVLTRETRPGWYNHLHKPPVMPPSTAFHPIWTCLYTLMGVSAWMVWPAKGYAGRVSKTCFLTQLALNVGWSVAFFQMRQPRLAFLEQVGFWAAIAATISSFERINIIAARLLYPYLAWATFAVYMNFEFALLNPDDR